MASIPLGRSLGLASATGLLTLLSIAPVHSAHSRPHAPGPHRIVAEPGAGPVAAVSTPVVGVIPFPVFRELNAKTFRVDTVEIGIQNLGDTTLAFDLSLTADDGGPDHVRVNGDVSYQSTIAAGGPTEFVTITYDGIGLPDPSEYNWRIELTSNDPASDPGAGGAPIDIILNVFVADVWHTCTQDTISTSTHRLSVSSCLGLGNRGAGGGLYSYASDREWFYTASPVVAWLDGPTERVYRDLYWTTLGQRSRDSNQAFRAQSELLIARDTTIATGLGLKSADVARGSASTTDSIFQIDWEVYAFKGGALSAGVVMQYALTNRTDSAFYGLTLGAVADVDIDSVITANAGIAEGIRFQYVGARGGFLLDSMFVPENHYAALFPVDLQPFCGQVFEGGQVLDNNIYVFPQEAFRTDSLYTLMTSTFFWNADVRPTDTVSDVSVLLVDRGNWSLFPNDTVRYAFGLVRSTISIADLELQIREFRQALNSDCYACLIEMTGDMNGSGTLTTADIIYLVNFVFKSGPEPPICRAAGDVNCSGAVTAADIIYLLGHVFKGQTGPCDACSQSPLAADCYP